MRTLLLAGVAAIGLGGNAEARAIGFDDLDGGRTAVQNGYGGLNWFNLYQFKGADFLPGSGYQTGTVSQGNAAFNGFGGLAGAYSSSPFTLNSGYFTAAFDTEIVNVYGYIDGFRAYSASFTALSSAPTFQTFNWTNLSGFGFYGGDGSNRSQVVLDDLDVTLAATTVPEPASLALLAAGILAGGVARRRRAV